MKKFILLVAVFITLSSCKKDHVNEALPAATQTGAGVFACKVNGRSFIDKSGGYFNCFYQLVGGEYNFGIGAHDNDFENTNLPWSIGLLTYDRAIAEGETLQLLERDIGNTFGQLGISPTVSNYYSVPTDQIYTGELTITKLDFTHKIVSGTFWFDVLSPITGERIEIREGRFDTIFTE